MNNHRVHASPSSAPWPALYGSYPNTPFPTPPDHALLLHSLQHLQQVQQNMAHWMRDIQHRLDNMQSSLSLLEQSRQPSNTYVYNDFEKFEICLDSLNLGTLSGSMQIGLFNGSSPTASMPPTITTANFAAPAGTPQSQLPSQTLTQTQLPAGAAAQEGIGDDFGPFEGILGGAGAGAGAGGSSSAPPGIEIPPGLPTPGGVSVQPGVIPFTPGGPTASTLPSGVTNVLPGMTLPPGSVEIAPGLAILPPGTSLIPAGSQARRTDREPI